MKLPPPPYKAIVGIILLVITLAPVSLSLSTRAQSKVDDIHGERISLSIDTNTVYAVDRGAKKVDPDSEKPAPSPCLEDGGWFIDVTACDIGVLFVQIIF